MPNLGEAARRRSISSYGFVRLTFVATFLKKPVEQSGGPDQDVSARRSEWQTVRGRRVDALVKCWRRTCTAPRAPGTARSKATTGSDYRYEEEERLHGRSSLAAVPSTSMRATRSMKRR
jgi:hypothetical protein